jgi:polysaccharide export outer membrane protein
LEIIWIGDAQLQYCTVANFSDSSRSKFLRLLTGGNVPWEAIENNGAKAILFGILLTFPGVFCVGQNIPTSLSNGGSSINLPSGGSPGTGGLSDIPFIPGQTIHIQVFEAPEFNETAPVSQSGDIPFPLFASVHIEGLTSKDAAELIQRRLKDAGFILDPHVLVTVEGGTSGITVLGEVKAPGIYAPLAKHQLSDVLSLAGGLTSTAGRVIEVSSPDASEKKVLLAWDPTLHNTASANVNIEPGQTVFVRPCGFIYVGGNVAKPGGYPICGSPVLHLSEAVALAGGVQSMSNTRHTLLVRTNSDGTRLVFDIQLDDVLKGKSGDMNLQEEDIFYIPVSGTKLTLKRLADAAVAFSGAAFYYFANH